MNTERPDNNDPGEAPGGGDARAAEAHGAGDAGAAKEPGAGTGDQVTSRTGGGRHAGTENAEGVTAGRSGATADADTTETPDAGADTDTGIAATEPNGSARPDSPVAVTRTAAAEWDGSASPDTSGESSAPEPAGLGQSRPSTDANATDIPIADTDTNSAATEPDDSAGPEAPATGTGTAATESPDSTSPDTPVAGTGTAAEPGDSASADIPDEPAASEVDGADAEAARPSSGGQDAPQGAARVGPGPDGDAGPRQAPDAPDSEIPRHEDDGSASRPSRHRSPVAVAAVAAAVLLVGGGGAYLAAHASGGSGEETASGASGDGTPPPLALDGYGASGGSGNGIAPGEPNPYGATYRVDGSLPDGPGSAPVYRVRGEVTAGEVTRLAEALGVEGTPVAQGQVWRVGVKDGSGPSLQVNRQAPGAWTFQRYSPVVDNCSSGAVCGAQPETPTDPPVSVAAAEKAAAPVLKALGQGTAKLDASQVMGAQRIVNADPLVGGLPTYGWATGVTVNGQGEVVGGTGQLKAPVKGDTYPVLSAEKTLGLLNKVPVADHRMGIGGCASPVPLKDRLEAPCGESTAGPAKSTLTVEKAVFGLASNFVGGRPALVPSWLFEVRAPGAKDAFTVTYPAVDPKYIAAPPAATPTAPASPTAPSDRPTSAPKTRDVQVDGYTAEGSELTVSFTGGVCGDYAATASESATEVKVTVTYTPWPDKVCIMIAKEMQKTVPLDEPLGDRTVVGSDGRRIPLQKAGARLPEVSGAR